MTAAARVSRATPAVARAQAAWIAAIDPWREMGYAAAGLARYLARKARAGAVLVTRSAPRATPVAVAVVDDGVLLGAFIALLAVRPDAAGQGLGTELVAHIRAEVGRTRGWLYVSCDGNNRAALRFYRRLGFLRVGRLPDMVRAGRVEILLRQSTGTSANLPTAAGRLGYHRRAR